MSTWEEIREHLRARFELVEEHPEWVGMVWTFTYEGRALTQRLKVECMAREWVLVLAAVCKADGINAASALRFNARLAIGALAIGGDTCYLRALLPLDTMDFRDLDRTIAFVARETARLRDPGFPSPEAKLLFTQFAD
jgi:hypothetical protein